MERLTIFAAPRPFDDEFGRIQRNAIFSWLCLDPAPDVLVFGGGSSAEQACRELGVRWVRDLPTATSGAPFLDALFARAQSLAETRLVAYANPDVIFLPTLMDALGTVEGKFGRFIAVGAPRNATVTGTLIGSSAEWGGAVAPAIADATWPARGSGADLFVFPLGALDPVPALTIGRLGWDNWLLWRCATSPLPSVDITVAGALIHQDHTGSTHRGSVAPTQQAFAEDVRNNMALLGRLDSIARRSEIEYEMSQDLRIGRRHRGGASYVRARLAARHVRLVALRWLRTTRLEGTVDRLERAWKQRRSG